MKTKILLLPIFAFAPSSSALTLLFDIGRSDLQTGGNWNNITEDTVELNSVIDSDGLATGIDLQVTDSLELGTLYSGNTWGSENPMGAAGAYPVSASDDYHYGFGDNNLLTPNPFGEIRLSNLNPNEVYNFTFFGARHNTPNEPEDNREGTYTAIGSNTDSVFLNAWNNDTVVARIFGISPDGSNEIILNFEAGPNNDNVSELFYLNVLEVNTRPIPEPSVALSLLVGALTLTWRRRVRC